MLSKNKIKYIRSLGQKKQRTLEGCFVAEGPKVVGDLLAVMPAELLVATEGWLARQPHPRPGGWESLGKEVAVCTEEELRKVSFLQHPQEVMAVFRMLSHQPSAPGEELCLALDGIQDPGNLGTIIRVADWFGIRTVYCSPDTADVYNPKVVQATMGSIARVGVVYADLPGFIGGLPEGVPVYGTLLDGEDIYGQELTPNGLIVMGNEGNGISAPVRSLIGRRLFIPSYASSQVHAESLNVAIATAIACAEFRRRARRGS